MISNSVTHLRTYNTVIGGNSVREPILPHQALMSLHRRFGKTTRISMISNRVTHLRSYTNSAIADITGNSAQISPVTRRDRWCLRIERRYRRIKWPPHDRRHHCPKCRRLHIKRRRLHIERRCRQIEWQVFECFMMFHNVLRVFHDVLLVVHDVLLVVHNVL